MSSNLQASAYPPPAAEAPAGGLPENKKGAVLKKPFALRKSIINIYYIPALLLFLLFIIFPFFNGIRISFTNWNGYLPEYKYIGFKNYVFLLHDPNIGISFLNTVIYGFGSTLFQNILGLAFALFLNTKFRGRTLLRTVIYLPVMIAPLIMGYAMFFFLQYSGGALNDLIHLFGMQPVDWLASGSRAVGIITAVNSLQYLGIAMIIYLAGLQNIPVMYHEAAAIDGIRPAAEFRYITLPLLLPAITSSVIINLIGGLKLFDIIQALTGSGSVSMGTSSLSTYLTYEYFNGNNAGYSAAIGIVTFLFIMGVSNIAMAFFHKKEVDFG